MWQRLIRLFKHRLQGDWASQPLISRDVLDRLSAAVARSESMHSGQIRIYVEAALPNSYLRLTTPFAQVVRRRAMSIFGKLRVWDTQQNNGVLIYLLLVERRLEIVADRGLSDLVPAQTWTELAGNMGLAFKSGDYERGLALALQEVDDLLQRHFPLSSGHVNSNELPDEPVLG
jgi:uncharacterized membrane protein